MDENIDSEFHLDKMREFFHLESEYPEHDRRSEGFKLIGFMEHDKKNPGPKNKSIIPGEYYNLHYPYGAVPIWRYLGHDIGKKYTGVKIRELEAKYGCGSKRNYAK